MSAPTVPGPDLPYGTVRHHALATVADSDDAGLHPDHHLLDGLEVEFRPSVQVIVWTGNGQPITHVPQVIKGRYDSEGRLRYVQRDGIMSTAQDVRLVVTEHPDMQPSGWVWRVSWKGAGATLPSGSFPLPAGGVVDLSSVLLAGSTPQAPVVFADLLAAASDLQATIDGAGTDAVDAASSAEQSASAASDFAGAAATSASNAATSATTAGTARDQAAASASTATAARDATLAASTIVGAGRPDVPATMTPETAALVAAATSGAVFRSTDGPQGAWEWQKRGAAWVVTAGDSGWRNVPEWMGAAFVSASVFGRLQVRRTPNTITLEGRVSPAAAIVGTNRNTAQTVVSFPAGWRAPANLSYATIGTGRIAGTAPVSLVLDETGSFQVREGTGSWTSPDILAFTAQLAAQGGAWPTTLPPGTPA